ncbi:3,4-dihydroxyphenylacetate 2,3-dioxygenase [Sphaerisporangium sp. NPDC051017]|uniref:3,4-dihydroxyphenylacetate 2,3-dioxygenase n=1 Tax=Sphaerisporangium sp. NPDC051017 TaxID=3154636 RepID=UPI00342CE5CF
MGSVVLAAKITHVPSIWLSLQTGTKHEGIRQNAVDGLVELGRRARERGADTFIVLDVHWQNNAGFHLNAREHVTGSYASHELPHFISGLRYDYRGDPELARLVVDEIRAAGMKALAHDVPDLGFEYGTLVPMHLMNPDGDLRVLSVGVNIYASIEEQRLVGEALRRAVDASDRDVALLASGSLSHEFPPNAISETKLNEHTNEFNRQVDMRVLELWQAGRMAEFIAMLPEYAKRCHGEAGMGDTAMLFGALGWDAYRGRGELLGRFFGSTGTGQANVEFTL